MAINDTIARIVMWGALAGQYVVGFVFAAAMLRLLVERRPRWAHLAALRLNNKQVSDRFLQWMRINRLAPYFKDRERLLAGCGYTGDAAMYVVARRLFFYLLPLSIAAAYGMTQMPNGIVPPIIAPLALAAAFLLLLWDRSWLGIIRRTRSERMTKEIYIVSNQLLYLAGSSLHIHTKLMRSLPFTRAMRADLQILLGEWYHDAEGALRRFKLRLGTEDGLSFVETIDSLRLHESEQYYQLLRERIQDYKEKLELAKESRKESTSYLLFVIAGIPILYTFQIFIYPWVREGQKLFSSLNS
ncbi:hypothetical protein PAECIP111893_02299 [Paenibacillus plantiphilus]|uniref:Type II secretion system protein GspF domain-containing protein n=1 Tax=Paenibacillus plantiphilus TaxID=2905650 RepID=A0ABN8GEH8_9BACL|nr:hypothetical protein [Paenibacillus plantiphilus]CAH1205162.1 hypothetical protein PAECIP111893_02299 [Paenibacillus plantiphilus]